MVSYKDLLFKFIEDENNRKYCMPILQKLLQQNKKGKYYSIKVGRDSKKFEQEELENKIKEICETMVEKSLKEGYNTMIVPSMISIDQAPNFYLFKEKPKEEEPYWWLYHLLTGIHFRDIVVNIVNISEELRKEFREFLINENFIILGKGEGLDVKEIISKAGNKNIKDCLDKEFVVGFLLLSYFAKFLSFQKEKEIKWSEIGDDTSLLVFVLHKQKKRIYIFPRLNLMISKWYEDLFTTNEPVIVPKISNFVFSLYVKDKKYREESKYLLNKFLYYFLSGYVNGDTLCKALEIKANYELSKLKSRKNKIYGFSAKSAHFFFSRL